MRVAPIAAVALAVAVAAPVAVAALQRPDGRSSYLPPVSEQQHAVAQALARGEVVSCGGGRGNVVALTFDDGPGPYSLRILQILRRHHAHASFFLVGNRLQYWPTAAREEARLGGVENHTWSHPRLPALPEWLVWLELLRTQYELGTVTGARPTLFRTPYALHSPRTDSVVRRLGLVEVFWDVDARDDVPNARVADIVRTVERGLRPGAIVLMHEIHPWTLRALPLVLHAIETRGLRPVSVPELLALDPPTRHQTCPYPRSGGQG